MENLQLTASSKMSGQSILNAKLKRPTLLYILGTSGDVPRDKILEFYKSMQLSIQLPSCKGGKAKLEQM